MNWVDALPPKCRRGSLPRCLLRTQGDAETVAGSLTNLVDLPNVHVDKNAWWMPKGLPVEIERHVGYQSYAGSETWKLKPFP